MGVFRNIENGGIWKCGETYTFEVYRPFSQGEYGSCEIGGQSGFWSEGGDLCSDDGNDDDPFKNENIIFENNEHDFTGGVSPSIIDDIEDVGDDWWKVTITLPPSEYMDLDVSHCLKYKTFEYCQVYA